MLRKRRLLWQLFPSYLLITVISLGALTWYASRSVRDSFIEQTAADLEARARLFEALLPNDIDPLDEKAIDSLCKTAGKHSGTRFTVILPSGRVVGDSDENPEKMDNHVDRPEIIEALNRKTGTSIRYSRTLGRDLMYLAIPLEKKDQTVAVIRASVAVGSIDRAIRDIQTRFAIVGLIAALFAALLSLLISRRLSHPIEAIRKGAECIARGDFHCSLPYSNTLEITGLSESMKEMARELHQRINTIESQRNELQAVLSSMAEGVIAVDGNEKLISINQAAARMLECKPSEARHRSIQEVARNTLLQKFVTSALQSDKPIEGCITLYSRGELILNLRGTSLEDPDGKRIGALIVLNDITRLKRLEHIRRDFVANVSHEIKTPITAIKGFVETLLDGALKSPADAERFLGIIDRHVDRLEAIVEDLLSLSRIEQETERSEIKLVKANIHEVLNMSIQLCETKAKPKKIELNLSCESDLVARVNPPLLEQAVVNLLDNAIKYSEPEKAIFLEAQATSEEILISVRDHGGGIESKHLPRLFERFYRVDKGRSRHVGGTGLGLAIVKHIIQAHGGRVSVESTPGEGSTFTIHLPPA
jgi:two-component system phosphate regulon sensor histidine kinase PhoR